MNGALTVGENIGDLGGLTIALTAYSIPADGDVGLEDAQKLFFNWAYCWRTKRRRELDQQYLTIDPHSPPEFRANIVRNLDEFHATFGTQRGRRAVARARGPRPHLVTAGRRAHGQAAYTRRLDWGPDRRPGARGRRAPR